MYGAKNSVLSFTNLIECRVLPNIYAKARLANLKDVENFCIGSD
jgi:hypothetical protein